MRFYFLARFLLAGYSYLLGLKAAHYVFLLLFFSIFALFKIINFLRTHYYTHDVHFQCLICHPYPMLFDLMTTIVFVISLFQIKF